LVGAGAVSGTAAGELWMNKDTPVKTAVQENNEVLFMEFEWEGLKTKGERETGKRPGKPPPHKWRRMARRERPRRSTATGAGNPPAPTADDFKW